jgi:hypothetical protein
MYGIQVPHEVQNNCRYKANENKYYLYQPNISVRKDACKLGRFTIARVRIKTVALPVPEVCQNFIYGIIRNHLKGSLFKGGCLYF